MTTPISITRHQGLEAIELRAPDGARATLLLHGAHLVSWVPAGADEQLYLSPKSAFATGQAIRGGVPVIFPQFATRGPLQRHGFARGKPWQLVSAESGGGATLKPLDDGSLLAEGPRPDKDVYALVVRPGLKRLTGLRIELLAHESLPMHGPGRQDNGNLHLNEIAAWVATDGHPDIERRLSLQNPLADFDQDGRGVAKALDGNPNSAWGIFPAVGQDHQASFEVAQPIELALGRAHVAHAGDAVGDQVAADTFLPGRRHGQVHVHVPQAGKHAHALGGDDLRACRHRERAHDADR